MMGNIVITISWKPNDSYDLIKTKLRNLAIDSGLSVDTNPAYFDYEPESHHPGYDDYRPGHTRSAAYIRVLSNSRKTISIIKSTKF